MSFLDQVEKIQKKPDHVRKKVVTVATVLSTSIIVVIWLTVANPLSLNTGQKSNDLKNDPFSVLKDTASVAGSALRDLKNGLNEVKSYAEVLKQQSGASTTEENLDLNNYGQN